MSPSRLNITLGLAFLSTFAFVGCSSPPDDDLEDVLEARRLRVLLTASAPPFASRDERGNIVGHEVDLARALAAELGDGIEVEFVDISFDAIISALEAGKGHVIVCNMTITPGRQAFVDFTDPYLSAGQIALVREDRRAEFPSVGSLDRAGVEIGCLVGSTGELAARRTFSKAKILTFETPMDAAYDVALGKSTAFVIDDTFRAEAVRTGLHRLVPVSEPFTEESIGIAVRKGQAALRERLNAALAALADRGVLGLLREEWGLASQ